MARKLAQGKLSYDVVNATSIWKFFAARRYIRNKDIRQALGKTLQNIFKEIFGFPLPKRIVLRLPFDHTIQRGKILQQTKRIIKMTNIPDSGKRILEDRVKVVFTKRKSIGDLILNHIPFSKSITNIDSTCACSHLIKDPTRHYARKVSEAKINEIEPLKQNRNNIPLPSRREAWASICKTLWIFKKKMESLNKNPLWINTYKAAKICIRNNTKHEYTSITEDEILHTKRALHNWVMTYTDKNPGMIVICCPQWYTNKMYDTFNFTKKNATYRMTSITTQDLHILWRNFYKAKHLKTIAPYDTKGDIPYGYILPKFKDIEKMRPIVSYKKHPLRKVLNISARALTFLLKSCTELKHLTLWETNHILPQIQMLTDRWIEKGYQYQLITGDIKNMFTTLPPEELIEATEWLMELIINKKRRNHYITVKRRGRGGVRYGKSYNKLSYTQIKYETLLDIIKFDICNCYFTMGNTLLKQIWGVPMGSPLSPIIAILVCARREHYYLNSLGREINLLKAIRYMDDVLIFTKYKKEDKEKTLKHIIGLMTCYHLCMDLEITDFGKEIKYLECEIKLKKGKLIVSHVIKNQESIIKQGTLNFMKTANYYSYNPKSNKLGTIIGTYCRILRNCSDHLELVKSVGMANEELTLLNYPRSIIKEGLERMYGKTKNKIWRILQRFPLGG